MQLSLRWSWGQLRKEEGEDQLRNCTKSQFLRNCRSATLGDNWWKEEGEDLLCNSAKSKFICNCPSAAFGDNCGRRDNCGRASRSIASIGLAIVLLKASLSLWRPFYSQKRREA